MIDNRTEGTEYGKGRVCLGVLTQTPDGPRGSTLVGGAARMVLLRASGRSICEKCMFAVISEKVVVSV